MLPRPSKKLLPNLYEVTDFDICKIFVNFTFNLTLVRFNLMKSAMNMMRAVEMAMAMMMEMMMRTCRRPVFVLA